MLIFSKFKKSFSPCSSAFRRTTNNSLRSFSVSSNLQGLRFCIWVALKFDTFTDEPYNMVSDILSCNNWHSIYWEALELLNKKGILLTSDSVRALVRSYSHLGHTDKAIEVFGRMRELDVIPDAHIYNTILRDVLRKQLFELASALYTTMVKSNVVPNLNTYNMLIDGFCKSGNMAGAYEMLIEMEKVNLTPDVVTYTSVLYGSCQAKNVDKARNVFNEMKIMKCPPDIVSCNVMLNGYCQMGRLDEALSFVLSMKTDGFSLNRNGYCSLLNAFFRARRYSEAYAWYARMFKEGIAPDVVMYAIMMHGLSDEGRVVEAAKMLDEMTQIGLIPDAYCYNAIIKGLCDIGLFNQAQSLRRKISEHNVYTHTIIISEMCKRGMIDEAQELFNRIEKLGCVPSVVTFNALIDGLCKADKLKEAYRLCSDMWRQYWLSSRGPDLQEKVEQMFAAGQFLNAYDYVTLTNSRVKPDIITYNILINACCRADEIEFAFHLFKELRTNGLSPDSVTYGTLIKECFIVDSEEKAFNILERMREAGCEPTLSFYKTLMTSLCKNRKVSPALSLYLKYLKSLPSRDNDSISALEEYLVGWKLDGGKLEQVIRGLLELDFRAKDFKLAPYTILLIGFCQVSVLEPVLHSLDVFQYVEMYKDVSWANVVRENFCALLFRMVCCMPQSLEQMSAKKIRRQKADCQFPCEH
ncbi:pentatricopeptide repeat-containing protein at1g79540-like protein [Trifolium pratense]|uniref:Pentatricopeptide repeat-containing protein at1g79540-like protein n=1 Tax=Trifolium pratense TaxID=57577 RepID=A0A2K3NWU8_TRIPR|nr:pentatricopeptide repeat-containing protein at1g79540-like protein [Trifolium pratense]